MKTIGMLGGMSWESSALYYRLINEEVKKRLGGLHSARIILSSVDFAEVVAMQSAGDWEGGAGLLSEAARDVERAGADLLIICTNTMHMVYGQVANSLAIPVLHIGDATADAVLEAGLTRVGLLGTRFTMEKDFYRERLEARGIEVLVPDGKGRKLVDRVIYQELCLGDVREKSRKDYLEVMEEMAGRGAEGIILGCTEIGMLVGSAHTALPLFDTIVLHAMSAVDMAME
jgi:aspartate racemase